MNEMGMEREGTLLGSRLNSPESVEKRGSSRAQTAAVARYLDWLERTSTSMTGKLSEEKLRERIASTEAEMADLPPVKRILALQRKRDWERDLAARQDKNTMQEEVEALFVENALGFHQRNELAYETWVDMGVPKGLLKKAGIGRGSR